MKPNEVIYHIKQDPQFSLVWAHFSREEKEDVVRRLEMQGPEALEKVLQEVKTGQYRLF